MSGDRKGVCVLGSTGALGQMVLGVLRAFPNRFTVVGLGAGRNLTLLAEQVKEFHPRKVAFAESLPLPEDSALLQTQIVPMEELAGDPSADVVVVASVGVADLKPTLRAIRAGKTVVLGNTEVLLMAGGLLKAEAAEHGATLVPVDNEVSAAWQCLMGEQDRPRWLIIPSRWGPVRSGQLGQMARVSPEAVSTHPTMPMGRKRAIDAATLMTKAVQVIQAHYLLDVPLDNIRVLFHPQDRARALVQLKDGYFKAILGPSNPRSAIQLALSYPQRWDNPTLPQLSLEDLGQLTFQPLEEGRFPCFRLAMRAARAGGTSLAVLNAANETAISLFLHRQIGFQDIPRIVERALIGHESKPNPSLEELLAADRWAREFAAQQVPE